MGDLDLEKIIKIQTILNLRTEAPVIETERIINLKPKFAKNPVLGEKQNRAREEKISKSGVAAKHIFNSAKNLDFWPEDSKFDDPRKADILSVLEIIEATEQFLKTSDLVERKNISIKNEDVQEQEKPIIVLIKKTKKEPVVQDLVPDNAFINQEPLGSAIHLGDTNFLEVFQDEPPGLEVYPDVKEVVLPEFFARPRKTERLRSSKNIKRAVGIFLTMAAAAFLFVSLLGWAQKAASLKEAVLNSGLAAYDSLLAAKQSLIRMDFLEAEKNFNKAYNDFASADSQINKAGGRLIVLLGKIPGLTGVSSRLRLVRIGEDLSRAGRDFSGILSLLARKPAEDSSENANKTPFSVLLAQARENLARGLESLASAKYNLDRTKISSLPSVVQSQMTTLKNKMPEILEVSASGLNWIDKALQILGHEKAKKYLFIFQNNAEARATGGFIGSYGVIDLDQGEIKNIFIEGIFNPDGQLREKIIPPRPIQKVAVSWGMRDANWFADFPTSAEKIIRFYEKTGGPTVDGVISLTPSVIERMLELTGPIEMPEYGVSLGSDNFVEVTQYKVEIDYDKTLNEPKKILADFAPRFIEKVRRAMEENSPEIIKIINQALLEKHILVYFSEPVLENFVKAQGWAGEILSSQSDYLNVVNTNINGQKTDRVVEQKIKYSSAIEEDGSIIDTVEIIRQHLGGSLPFKWYNGVNIDYLRVYAPKGSVLLFASGNKIEEYIPPADYEKLEFKSDADILAQEQGLKIDPVSGTQIFEETEKTVFGNWVYLNPGETAVLTYKYRLPFKISSSAKSADFSLLAQKQSGSPGSKLEIKVVWPLSWEVKSLPGGFMQNSNQVTQETDLGLDRLFNFKFSNVK